MNFPEHCNLCLPLFFSINFVTPNHVISFTLFYLPSLISLFLLLQLRRKVDKLEQSLKNKNTENKIKTKTNGSNTPTTSNNTSSLSAAVVAAELTDTVLLFSLLHCNPPRYSTCHHTVPHSNVACGKSIVHDTTLHCTTHKIKYTTLHLIALHYTSLCHTHKTHCITSHHIISYCTTLLHMQRCVVLMSTWHIIALTPLISACVASR